MPQEAEIIFKQKRFKPTDIVWSLIWLIKRIAYSTVPIPLLFWLAKAKGFIVSFVSSERFDVKRNLISVYGSNKSEREINTMARRHFEYLERFELSQVWPDLQGFAHAHRCPLEGLPYLEAALAQGKGAILLTTHLGYGRLIKYFLRVKGYPVLTVGPKDPKDKSHKMTKFAYFIYYRLLKVPEFSREKENDLPLALNVRPLVQALKKNEILLLTVDGKRSSRLMEVKLLGRRTAFATGSVRLAHETGATVLPVFVVDSNDGWIGMKSIIEPPLELERSGDAEQDVCRPLERYAQLYEDYIHRYPHLFHWRKRDFFSKRRLKALKADVADRLSGQYKTKMTR